MSMTRNLLAVAVCATACSPAWALLSINVLQDDTTVPGWVINTFTVDSGTDMTNAVAFADLSAGSMLQVPGFFPFKQSNGPGDSYVSINDDSNTIGWLGYGDLVGGAPPAFFDETGIGMTWFNISTGDIGTNMHLATLTFSQDTVADFELWVFSSESRRQNVYTITDGFAELTSTIAPPPTPDPPIDPDPLPNPDPDPGSDPPGPGLPGDPGPDGGGNPIPEPAGLGLLAVAAAGFGGLHRRRLNVAGK